MSGCSHGKTFKEPCTECQLVSAREGLAWALQGVEKYSKLITELSPGMSGPWIERGTGWAKVHNLPPAHLPAQPQSLVERAPSEFDIAVMKERDALRDAALDFIAKVDRGEARSTNSYAAFKTALSLTRPKLGGENG